MTVRAPHQPPPRPRVDDSPTQDGRPSTARSGTVGSGGTDRAGHESGGVRAEPFGGRSRGRSALVAAADEPADATDPVGRADGAAPGPRVAGADPAAAGTRVRAGDGADTGVTAGGSDLPAGGSRAPGRVGNRAADAGRAHVPARPALTVAAGGGYAARLVSGPGGRYPERWTLDGPEPYAVPLPGDASEHPATEVVPLADGRVLVSRPEAGGYDLALLYPSGPRTGRLALGSVETRRLRLLPPAPDGRRVYATASPPASEGDDQRGGPDDGAARGEAGSGVGSVVGSGSGRGGHTAFAPPRADTVTEVWLVCGGAFGPELVAEVSGTVSGGAWLDHEGLLLGLNRTDATGRTRALTVPVDGGGDPAVLLQIGDASNDRLLLADPDSGLLLVASDAPGTDRVGWGVLDSHRPVRFPEALCPEGLTVTPLAIQPGQMLLPEACGVALRLSAPEGEWIAVWRPQQRGLQHVATPAGWLSGTAQWTEDGELLLPRSTESTPCGLARIPVPVPALRPLRPGRHTRPGVLDDPFGGEGANRAASAGPSGAGGTGGASGAGGTGGLPDSARADGPARASTDGRAGAGEDSQTRMSADGPAGEVEAPAGVPGRAASDPARHEATGAPAPSLPAAEAGASAAGSDGLGHLPDGPAHADTPASEGGTPASDGADPAVDRPSAGAAEVPAPRAPAEPARSWSGAVCRPVPLHRAPQARGY